MRYAVLNVVVVIGKRFWKIWKIFNGELVNEMPSKYTVGVVLDDETNTIWDNLPVGERSKRIRAALKNAAIVNERDMLVSALRQQIKRWTHRCDHLEISLMMCKCPINKKYKEEEE